jgi:hypothetical protein
LFLDGVGLGDDDPAVNPLAAATLPNITRLLGGRRPVASAGRVSAAEAEMVPTDAQLGVGGRPQSATGQAAILTGINAPARLGEHYGPRPDARVRAVIDEGNLFHTLAAAGYATRFCNAYPHGYFDAVGRGKRLLSAIPYAATSAGHTLYNHADLRAGRAIAADFTNAGWRTQLGYGDTPVYTPGQGGALVWQLAQDVQFLLFEHWYTDLLGHHQDLPGAVRVLETFDSFLGGLLAAADLDQTLIIVGSDHGNVEDCSHGKHTMNRSLTLVMGAQRAAVAARIQDLTDYAPVVRAFLDGRL